MTGRRMESSDVSHVAQFLHDDDVGSIVKENPALKIIQFLPGLAA